MFNTLICTEKINKFPFSSLSRNLSIKESESLPLISFSGNFIHKPSSPYHQQWNDNNGYIFLSRFNLNDEWLIQMNNKKKSKIQFSPKTIPFYFFDSQNGNITLESNVSENVSSTVGYLGDFNNFYISNENNDIYTFEEIRSNRSEFYPNYYLISYTENVDIQVTLEGPGV